MLRTIQELHEGMQARVIVEGSLTDEFEVKNGVRQGCCLASLLFNIYAAAWTQEWCSSAPPGVELKYKIDGTVYRHGQDDRIKANTVVVKDGHYVDDAVALSASVQEQNIVALQYQEIASKWG